MHENHQSLLEKASSPHKVRDAAAAVECDQPALLGRSHGQQRGVQSERVGDGEEADAVNALHPHREHAQRARNEGLPRARRRHAGAGGGRGHSAWRGGPAPSAARRAAPPGRSRARPQARCAQPAQRFRRRARQVRGCIGHASRTKPRCQARPCPRPSSAPAARPPRPRDPPSTARRCPARTPCPRKRAAGTSPAAAYARALGSPAREEVSEPHPQTVRQAPSCRRPAGRRPRSPPAPRCTPGPATGLLARARLACRPHTRRVRPAAPVAADHSPATWLVATQSASSAVRRVMCRSSDKRAPTDGPRAQLRSVGADAPHVPRVSTVPCAPNTSTWPAPADSTPTATRPRGPYHSGRQLPQPCYPCVPRQRRWPSRLACRAAARKRERERERERWEACAGRSPQRASKGWSRASRRRLRPQPRRLPRARRTRSPPAPCAPHALAALQEATHCPKRALQLRSGQGGRTAGGVIDAEHPVGARGHK